MGGGKGGGNIHDGDKPRPRPVSPPAPPAPPPPPLEEWKANIEWSLHDEGPAESEVQKEWTRLDGAYPGTNLMVRCCLNPFGRGRKCVMEIAIDCAKRGFDQKAFDITISTQFQNSHAKDTISAAGVWNVAQYLRAPS
jgi:hypothetical protein